MRKVKMTEGRPKHRKNSNPLPHLKNSVLNGKLLKIPTPTNTKEE
jgi:hypothetical protein